MMTTIPNNELYKTPLAFAQWRVNELKKPVESGIINEIIAIVIEVVNGLLGQHDITHNPQTDVETNESTTNDENPNWALKSIRKVSAGFREVLEFMSVGVTAIGNINRVIMPFLVYVGISIYVGINSREFKSNIYRVLALLLLYIISYTELKSVPFFILFIVGIIVETMLIVHQYGSE